MAAKAKSKNETVSTASTISSGWQIFKRSLDQLWQQRQLFFGVTLVYGLFSLVFVHGTGSLVNMSGINNATSLKNGYSRFSAILGSAGAASNEASSLYQSILLIIAALAFIWIMRQLQKNNKSSTPLSLTVRNVYYHSTYALIPFVLVLMLISVQLLPMLIGASVYSMVISNGLAVGSIENIGWLALFLVLSIWSLYMITASIFGLLVVTLPHMTPMQAWRSARKLVDGRRWMIMRKLLFLPFILLIIVAIVMLPVAIWLAVIAEWVYFVISIVVLPVCVVYLYNLYREIL